MTGKDYLNYYKTILEKVSFDKRLFAKEYAKAVNHLDDDEAGTLSRWVRSKGYDRRMGYN